MTNEEGVWTVRWGTGIPVDFDREIVIDAGSVVKVDEEGVVTIMSGYQFDKKKFPGLGSFAPDKKHSAGPVFPDKPTTVIKTEEVEAKKASIAEQINKALAPFVGKVFGVDFGKEEAKAVVATVLENQILEVKTLGGIPDAVATVSVSGKTIGLVKGFNPHVIDVDEVYELGKAEYVGALTAPKDKEQNVGLSKLAAKDKINKKSKPKKKTKAEPIYQWTFTSGQEVEGTRAKYSTLLRADKSTSCNCPGWVFKRGPGERSCKHTRAIESEVEGIYKKWKKGEPLPKVEDQAAGGSELPGMNVSGASLNYSRKMDI